MKRSKEDTQKIIANFRKPDRSQYAELDGYSDDECYHDFSGGGGLYLATHMLRTLHINPRDLVLDLGCGKGSTSIFMARQYGARVVALDLWTTAEFLNEKFKSHELTEQVSGLQLDARESLPFPENFFDTIFCMNSFNFYGGSIQYLHHILKYLRPGGRICIGSEALSAEFTAEQMKNPPLVYAFRLPPPNEHVNVFEDDFAKQHTPAWWRNLFETSGLVDVEYCHELEDADAIYEELVRYEHERGSDPFDVQICLDQIEWGRAHSPRKTLFVLTARKR